MKFCPSCEIDKNKDCFYLNKRTPDGMAYICKVCAALYSKQYREDNKEKLAKNKKDWYLENKEHSISYAAEYYKNNKEEVIRKVISYRKNRLKTDVTFRLRKNLRNRLSKLLKQQSSKVAIDFLGCDLDHLKTYLESKFYPNPKNGHMMTWNNYGEWHIDHKKALANFDLMDKDQLKDACAYTNLQPLWASENRSKSNKVQ